MVLTEQVSALIDYLENHQELALGHSSRTNEGRVLAKQYWMEIAQILNSISPDCPNKTPTEWRTFYNEYKSKTLKKIKAQSEVSAAGGVPVNKNLLTPLQTRLYTLLTRDVEEPLPGLQHSPLTIHPLSFTVDQSPKRRRLSVQSYESEERDQPQQSTFEAVQTRLEAIEEKNAEATFIQAQAINNLAAAIDRQSSATEKMVDLLGHFLTSVSKKKFHKLLLSSDSEGE